MRKRNKYQFGGHEETYGFDFIESLSQQLTEQNQAVEEEYEPEQYVQNSEGEDMDYEALEQEYNDLQSRYDELSSNVNLNAANPVVNQNFDDNFLNFLFDDKDDKMPINPDNLYSVPKNNSAPSSVSGLSGRANSVLDILKQEAGDFDITSGRRTAERNRAVGGTPNSFHLTGDAVDLRPNSSIDNFLKSSRGRDLLSKKGYEIIDERNRKGHGAHWHLEPKKRQFGGVAEANTKDELYTGLNVDHLNELMLNLPKQYNLIRGLDNGQPVYLKDEKGKEKVLHGPNDTTKMYGKVYEKKYQVGGNVAESTGRVKPNPAFFKKTDELPVYKDKKNTDNLKKLYTYKGEDNQDWMDTTGYNAMLPILKENNNPNINIKEKGRPYYNPFSNSVNVRNEDNLLAELTHAQQTKERGIHGVSLQWLKDVVTNAAFTTNRYDKLYDIEGTLENDAHKKDRKQLIYNKYVANRLKISKNQ